MERQIHDNRKSLCSLHMRDSTADDITALSLKGIYLGNGSCHILSFGITHGLDGYGIVTAYSDITDFYYTYDWTGYNARYQRYRFYVEDEEYLFYHETRKTEDDYGWGAEADITASGTVSLSIYEWDEFLYFLSEGSATEPEEYTEAGDSGPWMYLYFRSGDETVRKEYHFASAERQSAFEEFCQSLASESSVP